MLGRARCPAAEDNTTTVPCPCARIRCATARPLDTARVVHDRDVAGLRRGFVEHASLVDQSERDDREIDVLATEARLLKGGGNDRFVRVDQLGIERDRLDVRARGAQRRDLLAERVGMSCRKDHGAGTARDECPCDRKAEVGAAAEHEYGARIACVVHGAAV